MMFGRSGKLVVILVSVLAAFAAGYLLGRYPLQREVTDANAFLYGPSQDIEKWVDSDASEDRAFYKAIHMMLTDYRARIPIHKDRKVLLLDFLRQDVSYKELALSLALGAVQDDAAEVREACVAVLADWQSYLAQAGQMIERNIDRETNSSIRRAKRFLIQRLQVHSGRGSKANDLQG